MASRGVMVAGTSGADYEHREQVAQQYQLSVVNKYRLRCAIFFHCVLWLAMCAKLSAAALDALDIFVLELEELALPGARAWEWAWALSPAGAALALAALRRNDAARLRRARLLLAALGLLPLLAAGTLLAIDAWRLLSGVEVERWRERPLAALWLPFVALAAQVHGFELLFASRLLGAWRARGLLRKQH